MFLLKIHIFISIPPSYMYFLDKDHISHTKVKKALKTQNNDLIKTYDENSWYCSSYPVLFYGFMVKVLKVFETYIFFFFIGNFFKENLAKNWCNIIHVPDSVTAITIIRLLLIFYEYIDWLPFNNSHNYYTI